MKPVIGIELGSTRIKAVAVDTAGNVLAEGSYGWENEWRGGEWTYGIDNVWLGLRSAYADLACDWLAKQGSELTEVAAIGISAMMHGYVALNESGEVISPFRTWRNTDTGAEAQELSELFGFNIPMRWSVSHLYRAVNRKEKHLSKLNFVTTLAGYVHYKLTGKKVLGVGDASGMFPIDSATGDYVSSYVNKFEKLISDKGYNLKIKEIFPRVLSAGENAGTLTEAGALLLDESGKLKSGVPLCPPEGDAGTGMTATNSVSYGTGNVSAGTSAFVMVVLGKPLKRAYPEIDMVTTPCGKPVAMVHVNNCTNEINAWAKLFGEVASLAGAQVGGDWYTELFKKSAQSDGDCGKLTAYNFLSGEPIAGVNSGVPLLLRPCDSEFNLANFMQVQIYSALASLRLGMEILEREKVNVDEICGHGGFFKTEFIGQNAMSAALNAPVTVMSNAGEGGAWGIALLALYSLKKKGSLAEFLSGIFADTKKTTVTASDEESKKFARFMNSYKANLIVEKTASEVK